MISGNRKLCLIFTVIGVFITALSVVLVTKITSKATDSNSINRRAAGNADIVKTCKKLIILADRDKQRLVFELNVFIKNVDVFEGNPNIEEELKIPKGQVLDFMKCIKGLKRRSERLAGKIEMAQDKNTQMPHRQYEIEIDAIKILLSDMILIFREK